MKFVANRYADPITAARTAVGSEPVPEIAFTDAAATVAPATEFTVYVAWASTSASCAEICYDAVDGKMDMTITSLAVTGASATAWHGWDVYWK